MFAETPLGRKALIVLALLCALAVLVTVCRSLAGPSQTTVAQVNCATLEVPQGGEGSWTVQTPGGRRALDTLPEAQQTACASHLPGAGGDGP